MGTSDVGPSPAVPGSRSHLAASIKEFFGTSPVVAVHGPDQPAGRAHPKRRLSAPRPVPRACGVRGSATTRRTTAACARIETPKVPTYLIGSLATYGRVNPFGFVETPYRRVVDGVVTDTCGLPVGRRRGPARHRPGQLGTEPDGTFVGDRVLVRRKGWRGRLRGLVTRSTTSTSRAPDGLRRHRDDSVPGA